MKGLKDYRSKELSAYVLANTLVCLICTGTSEKFYHLLLI